MTPREILAEFLSLPPLRAVEFNWFRRQGVPPQALFRPELIRTAEIAFFGARFEFAADAPAEQSSRAAIFEAYGTFGDVADLIAWQPKIGALASWLGRVALLGEEQIFGPRLGPRLTVHATPMQWLRAERLGVAVVDPRTAAGLLRDAGPLAVASHAERRRLEGLLTLRAPTIGVESAVVRRAAA